ncbi:unnamed protein product [Lampetra planeri]
MAHAARPRLLHHHHLHHPTATSNEGGKQRLSLAAYYQPPSPQQLNTALTYSHSSVKRRREGEASRGAAFTPGPPSAPTSEATSPLVVVF